MGNQMSQAELDVKLVEAAQRGTEEQVALLLKSGANPNAPPPTDEHNFLNRTALHHAVLYRSDVGKLELILRHCSDIGETSLITLLREGMGTFRLSAIRTGNGRLNIYF